MGINRAIISNNKSNISNKIIIMYNNCKFNKYVNDSLNKIRNIKSSIIFIYKLKEEIKWNKRLI